LKAIQKQKPDLIFLDIQMPRLSGFELLELLEEVPAVIFTTAFDEYAIQAFEVNAVDYLLKPYSQIRFREAVTRFLENREKQSRNIATMLMDKTPEPVTRMVVRWNHDVVVLPLSEIQLFEAADDYVKLITEKGEYLKKKTLQSVDDSLPAGQFVRIHRSYLLNIQFLDKIELYDKESYRATLKNGKKIPVSRSGYQKLKEILGI
jgi:two-component system LytT family response regulator